MPVVTSQTDVSFGFLVDAIRRGGVTIIVNHRGSSNGFFKVPLLRLLAGFINNAPFRGTRLNKDNRWWPCCQRPRFCLLLIVWDDNASFWGSRCCDVVVGDFYHRGRAELLNGFFIRRITDLGFLALCFVLCEGNNEISGIVNCADSKLPRLPAWTSTHKGQVMAEYKVINKIKQGVDVCPAWWNRADRVTFKVIDVLLEAATGIYGIFTKSAGKGEH